jgi:hypothetical protein
MSALRWLTAIAGLLCLPLACGTRAAEPDKIMAGWLETIEVSELPDHELKAKLDSGAKTSSINARNIEAFTRDGRPWVRFELALKNRQGKTRTVDLERPRLRSVLIKERDGKPGKRPVVGLEICFAGHRYPAEFTLADRTEFNYPVLLGRRFLAGVALIDPQATYLTQPDCADRGKAARGKAGTGAPDQP